MSRLEATLYDGKKSKPRTSYKGSSLKFATCYRCDQVSVSSTSRGTNDTYLLHKMAVKISNIMSIKVFGTYKRASKMVCDLCL